MRITTLRDDLNSRLVNGVFRILIRDVDDFYSALELQLVIGKGETSAYIKPPAEGLFVTKALWDKYPLPTDPEARKMAVDISLDNSIDASGKRFNPYYSWHGSGEIHANAFDDSSLTKTKLLTKSAAIGSRDITGIHLVGSVIVPTDPVSLPKTTAPPLDFAGSYYEVSEQPYISNDFTRPGRLNLVIDRRILNNQHIALDLFVHRQPRAKIEDLPYAKGSKFTPIDKPFTYKVDSVDNPNKFTIFIYEPQEDNSDTTVKRSLTFIGRADNVTEAIVFQASKVELAEPTG